MAKDAFDFSDIFSDIQKKIGDVMQSSEAESKAREIMALAAEEGVYSKYQPTEYVRRHTMDNPSSYRVEASDNTITIENVATESDVFNVVESGVGYTWEHSRIYGMQPFPRPYSQNGIDQFVDLWLMPEIERKVFSK